MRRLTTTAVALCALLAACASGPSPAVAERNALPSTTTTTEPPPEGVIVVDISNGRFAPSNLALDLTKTWIVEWQNNDPPREYTINSSTDAFESSPLLLPGDTWQVDFSQFEPGVYRYNTFLGNQRIPGLIDTRPPR